jgi:hypothetical protein
MQGYNQQPGFAQGGLAPQFLPNQQSLQQSEQTKPEPDLLQQPTQPELDSRNQPAFSQQHPVQPELDSRNQPAFSQQHPVQPELDSRNQPAFSQQHPVQPELDSRGQTALPYNQPVQGELDSNTPSNSHQGSYQQHYQPSQAELEHPNRGPPQLRGSSVLYEAP